VAASILVNRRSPVRAPSMAFPRPACRPGQGTGGHRRKTFDVTDACASRDRVEARELLPLPQTPLNPPPGCLLLRGMVRSRLRRLCWRAPRHPDHVFGPLPSRVEGCDPPGACFRRALSSLPPASLPALGVCVLARDAKPKGPMPSVRQPVIVRSRTGRRVRPRPGPAGWRR